MNTIRLPRKRPRVTSTNWRTFAWLVHREACLHIVYPHDGRPGELAAARAWAYRWRRSGMDRVSLNLLKFFPERRWYYGPEGRPASNDHGPALHAGP